MFVSVLLRDNETYHLAVWPSWHVEKRIESANHLAAPAEALEFSHLADEIVSVLQRNSVNFTCR